NGGQAKFAGIVTGSLTSPRIKGNLAVNGFSFEGRQFDSLAADLSASSSGASVANGALHRNAMQAQFAASVGMWNWKITPKNQLSAEASIHNGDLADIMAMAGQPSAEYSGALNLDAHVAGAVGNPSGSANVVVVNGSLQGEPFDRVQTQVKMADRLI